MTGFGESPIFDHPAEEAVLGVCLISGRATEILATEEGLRPEHFFTSWHQRAYRAMLDLQDDGGGIDPLTVAGRIDRDGGETPNHGGSWKGHLDALTGGVPNAGAAREYARRVVDAWRWERQRQAHRTALVAITERDQGALTEAQRAADQLVVHGPGEHLTDPAELAAHMLDWLERPREGGLPLPWPTLQKSLRLRRGHTTVIAGWTSIGKSMAADQIAAHIGRSDLRAVLWINEMTREERVCRQITRETGQLYDTLIDGTLGQRDLERVVQAIAGLPFGVVEAHGWPADHIARHLRQVRPDLAVVDHFHALPGVGKTDGADEAVSQLVAGAANADCHLLLVAQLNQTRNIQSVRPAPVLRDLRGTGNLANLPSNVLLVHRDEKDMTDLEGNKLGRARPGEFGHLDIVKQRGGELTIVPVRFDSRRLAFSECL